MKLSEKIIEVRKEWGINVNVSNIYDGDIVDICIVLSYAQSNGMTLIDKNRVPAKFPEDTIIKIIDERVEVLKKCIGERFKKRILKDLKNLKEECKDLMVEVIDEDSY